MHVFFNGQSVNPRAKMMNAIKRKRKKETHEINAHFCNFHFLRSETTMKIEKTMIEETVKSKSTKQSRMRCHLKLCAVYRIHLSHYWMEHPNIIHL
jgi:hypothetical protein